MMSCIRACVSVLAVTFAAASASHWEFERVDSGGSGYVHLCRAPDNDILVCYPSLTGAVRVARRDTAWRRETVAALAGVAAACRPDFNVGPHGELGIAVVDSDGRIVLAQRADSGWVAESTGLTLPLLDAQVHVAFDSSGRPALAYTFNGDSLPGGVLFAQKTDSGWVKDSVYWYAPQPGYRARYGCCGLEFDARNVPHVGMHSGSGRYAPNPGWSWGFRGVVRMSDGWHTERLNGGMHQQVAGWDVAVRGDTGMSYCFEMGVDSLVPRYPYCDDYLVEGVRFLSLAVAADRRSRRGVAYVPRDTTLRFAYWGGTGWRPVSVPGVTRAKVCDIVLDSLGEPLIAYAAAGELMLAHALGVVGVQTNPMPIATRVASIAGIVRGVLDLPHSKPDGLRQELLDVCGRRVLELRAGVNDVSGLAPGVYFVVARHPDFPSQEERQPPSAVTKVVLTR